VFTFSSSDGTYNLIIVIFHCQFKFTLIKFSLIVHSKISTEFFFKIIETSLLVSLYSIIKINESINRFEFTALFFVSVRVISNFSSSFIMIPCLFFNPYTFHILKCIICFHCPFCLLLFPLFRDFV